MGSNIDIDLRRSTDITFTCVKCGLTRVVAPEGARLWLRDNGGRNPLHVADQGEMKPTQNGEPYVVPKD